jgi:hypothetical protein
MAIRGNAVRVLENSFEANGTAGCLQVLGSQGGLLPSADILVTLGNEFIGCDPYGIELGPNVDDVNIVGNEFPGSSDGITTSNATPWDVTDRVRIRNNRFVGTTHLGVENTTSGTLGAEQNWWGCNAGPGAAGCDAVSAGVDADHPVALGALIGPRQEEDGIEELPKGNSITLNPGEQAEVAALLIDGGSEPDLSVPSEKSPIGFSSSLGTLSPTTSHLLNGWTKAIFTAGATPGQGWIVVSMDNQHTLVPVTIRGDTTSTQPQTIPGNSSRAPTIAFSSKVLLSTGRRITIGRITCAEACRVKPGRAWISVGRHRYRGKVSPRGDLAAESTTPIRVAVPPPAFHALQSVGRARIRVGISALDALGQTTQRSISVKVQR